MWRGWISRLDYLKSLNSPPECIFHCGVVNQGKDRAIQNSLEQASSQSGKLNYRLHRFDFYIGFKQISVLDVCFISVAEVCFEELIRAQAEREHGAVFILLKSKNGISLLKTSKKGKLNPDHLLASRSPNWS